MSSRTSLGDQNSWLRTDIPVCPWEKISIIDPNYTTVTTSIEQMSLASSLLRAPCRFYETHARQFTHNLIDETNPKSWVERHPKDPGVIKVCEYPVKLHKRFIQTLHTTYCLFLASIDMKTSLVLYWSPALHANLKLLFGIFTSSTGVSPLFLAIPRW